VPSRSRLAGRQHGLVRVRDGRVGRVREPRHAVVDFTGCTLREAITAANVTPGAILLPPGVYAFEQAAADDDTNDSGDLDIRNGLAIYGAGTAETVIDASQIDRLLHVDPLAFNRLTVTVADLTLRNGTVSGDGGALRVSGTSNFLTLQRVRLHDNVATGSGGALSTTSRGALLDSSVVANIALGFGGGLALVGGADSTFLVQGATISGNRSQAVADAGGGGIYSVTRVRISNTTISGQRRPEWRSSVGARFVHPCAWRAWRC
jgi:hypothetical protein